MPRTEDAAAESVSSNATLCGHCSKALQKPLVCARCKMMIVLLLFLQKQNLSATYCSKDCQVHIAHRTRGGLAIKAVIASAHTNTNVTE